MATPTVEISSVRKKFGPTVALGGCNLRAYAGEVHAIVGGNGSGKSTLAKIISGVVIPDSGQVSILGKSATSPVEARRMGIANVFQEVLVADELSVFDNLYMGADWLFATRMSYDEKRARAEALMRDLLAFDLDLSVPVGELPLSLKQWITIARGLLSEPKVLILDESSAALDFESTERLFDKMRELKRDGASVLIVTHRIAELVRIADRATVLRDGVDVGELGREEITEHRIFELIAGPEREAESHDQPVPRAMGAQPAMRVSQARVWADGGMIDFVLYPGEVVGVTGLDGHGQSAFVQSLAGIQPLVSGSIAAIADWRSRSITDLASARAANISYVSGDRKREGIFANLSIFENLVIPVYHEYRLGGPLDLINHTQLDPIFRWESERLNVKMGDRSDLITSLSGGNQQKVLIARAFAEKPAVLVLNDPARGIDVGAKLDLYHNLRAFAARGNAVVFLSSEVEEFLGLCTRVLVFRNGSVGSEFEPPFDGTSILNAMFGRRAGAPMREDELPKAAPPPRKSALEDGRPAPRRVTVGPPPRRRPALEPDAAFDLRAPEIAPGGEIPALYAEDSPVSPRLVWTGVPAGTRSFALSVTDPDLPEEFGFPRVFAHWLVCDIPADVREMPEGASRGPGLPEGAREMNSDFVTSGIPGFGVGWGGPWPPDRAHRYVFTLHALKAERLSLAAETDLPAFAAAVTPATIGTASFTARYGPARKPLPE